MYSDKNGAYSLKNLWSGEYSVAVERANYEKPNTVLLKVDPNDRKEMNFALTLGQLKVKMSDPDYLNELPDGNGKALIRSVCIQCHGLAEKIIAQQKTIAQWTTTVDDMLARVAPLPDGQKEIILNFLIDNLGRDTERSLPLFKIKSFPDVNRVTQSAVFTEYSMPPRTNGIYDPTTGTNLTTHDVRVDKNGMIWISEMSRDSLVKLDPVTASFTEYPIGYDKSGPHGIIVDPDNDVWLTLIWADRILKFDQAQNKFTIDVKIPRSPSWPHTIVYDSKGVLWFTEMYANAIGSYDPAADQFERFILPTSRATPYGLAVDSKDNVWFTGITYHTIGKIDAITRKISEYPTPTRLSATRKLIVDHDDNVWCSEFGVGRIAMLNSDTNRIIEYTLPNRYSSPYDMIVDEQGNIWFPDFTGNNVIKFEPTSEAFTEFRIPTPFARPRIVDIGTDGSIWFSESEVGKIGRLQFP